MMYVGCRGFSLTGMVIAVGILGVTVLSSAAIMSSMARSSRYAAQRNLVGELRERFKRDIRDVTICNCHLNPNLTQDDSNDANLRVNSTVTDGSGVVNLTRIREGCAVTDPVVAELGQNLGEGLLVDGIFLAGLVPTRNLNEWRGTWRITFRTAAEGTPLAPLEVSQFFYLDPLSAVATPAAALIERCKGDTPAVINDCPAGMAMVGLAGQFGTFCISQTEHGPGSRLDFLAAKDACAASSPPGFGPLRMCDQNHWFAACEALGDPSFTDGREEWIDDAASDGAPTVSGGAGNCAAVNFGGGSLDENHYFRCCAW